MSNKIKIDPRNVDLKKLKEFLSKGDYKHIADKTGFSKNYVSIVLNPKQPRENAKILACAVRLVQDRVTVEVDPEIASAITKNGQKSVH